MSTLVIKLITLKYLISEESRLINAYEYISNQINHTENLTHLATQGMIIPAADHEIPFTTQAQGLSPQVFAASSMHDQTLLSLYDALEYY